MKKFSQDNILLSVTLPKEFNEDFTTCTLFDQRINTPSQDLDSECVCDLPSCSSKSVLSPIELSSVLGVILKLKNVPISSIHVRSCFQKYTTVKLGGVEYSSLLNKASHHNVLFADWKVDIFGLPPSRLPEPPS